MNNADNHPVFFPGELDFLHQRGKGNNFCLFGKPECQLNPVALLNELGGYLLFHGFFIMNPPGIFFADLSFVQAVGNNIVRCVYIDHVNMETMQGVFNNRVKKLILAWFPQLYLSMFENHRPDKS